MFQRLLHSRCFKMIAVFVLVAYLSSIPSQSGYAQTLTPAPGQMLATSPALNPPVMMGMRVDVKNPFNLYFIMKDGDHKLEQQERELEYRKLIKYFMASLVIPNQDMWVNLSPRESERIIPDNFSMTEMGRDLLEQDYLLKQFTSSLLFPESSPGKEFWSRIYARAYARFGTTDIPVDTFNKVWITADKADIYQKNDTAILVKSHLKVMLEQDFLAGRDTAVKQSAGIADAGVAEPSSQMASDVMRDVVIPVIEQEVNTGAHFAALRQAYNSMIMATWFKQNLKNSLLGQVYADTGKVGGIELNDPQSKERIYRQYMEAYKAGVFNYVKEEWDAGSRELLPRKYFSGGITAIGPDIINPAVSFAEAMAVVAPAAAAISVTSVGLQTTDGAMITAPVSASATQQKKAAASVAAKRQWVQNRLQRVRQLIATTRRQLADARQKRLARGKAETMWFEWAPGDYFQGIRGAQPLDIAARMVLQMQAYVPVRTGAPFATLDNVRAWHDQIYGKADNIVQAHRNAARWLVETDLPFRGLAAMAAKGALTSKQRAALQVELLKARVSFKDLADEAVVARLSRGALGRDIKKAILRELYGFRTTSDRFSTAASPKTWSPSFMSLRLMGAYALTEFSRIWQSRGKSSRTSVFGWRKWVLSLMLALQVSSAVAPAAAAIVQQAPVPTPVAEVQTTPPAAGPDMLHLPDVLAVSGAETTSGQAAAQSDQTKITLVDRFNAGGVLTAAPGELVSARELGIGLINTAQGLRNLSDLDARVLLREYTASDADMKDMVVRTVLYQGKRMVVAAYTDSTVSRSDKGPSARLGARAASGVSGAVAAGTPVVAPAATPAETQSLQVIDRFTGQVQEQTVDLKDGTWRQLGENDLLTKRTLQVAGSAKVFRAGTWIRLQAAQDLGTDLPQGVRPANGKVITAYIEPTASSESSSVPSVQPSADTADAGRRTLLPVAAGRATLDEEAEYYRSIESMDELSDLESKVSAMYFSIQYAETAGLDNPWIRTFGDPKSGKVSSAAFPVQITYTLARDNVRRGRMSKESADFFRQVLEPIYKKFFQHTGKIGTPGYDPRFDYGGTGGFDPVKFGPAYKKFAKELIRLHLQDAKGNERRALAAWRGATEQEDPRYFQRYDTAREAVRKAPGRMEIAEELADVVETLAQRRTQAAEMRREQEQNRKARQTYEQEQARSKARVAEEKKKTFTQQHMFLTQEMRRLQALGGVGFDAQDLPASLTWVMDYNYPLASVPLGTPSGDPSLGFMLNINHPFKSIAEATQIAKGFGGTVNGAPISDISTVLGPLRLLDIGMELYNYGLMHPNRNQTKLYHTDKDPIQGIINTLTINWTDVEAANEENQMQRKTVFSVGLYDSLRAIPGFFDRITFKGVTPLWQLMGNVNLRFPFENAGDQMQYGLYQMAFEYAAANKPAARDDVVFVELFEVTDPNTKYVRNEENGYDVQPTAQGEDKVHYRGTVKGYMLRLQSDGQVQAREVFSSPAFLTHGFIKAEAGAQAGLKTVVIKPLVSRESLANEMAVLEGKTADGKKVYGGLRHPVSGEMVRVITDPRELNLLQQVPTGGQYLPVKIGTPLTAEETRQHKPRSLLQEAGAVIVDYTGDQLRMTLRSWRNMFGKQETIAERADDVDFNKRPISEDLRVKGFAASKVNGYMFQAGQLLQDIEAEGEAMSGWVRHFDGTLSEPVSGTSQFKVVKWLKPAEFELLRKTVGAQKTDTGLSVTIQGITYLIDDSVLVQLPSAGKNFGIFDPSSRTKKLWYDQIKKKEHDLAVRYAGFFQNAGIALNVATGKQTVVETASDFRPARYAGDGIVGQKITVKGDTEPIIVTGDMMVRVQNGQVTDLFEPGVRTLENRMVVLQTRLDGGFEIENRATGKFEIYAKGNSLTAEQKAAGIKPESELVRLMVEGKVKSVPVESSRPEGPKRLIIIDTAKERVPARRLVPGGAQAVREGNVTSVSVAPGSLSGVAARPVAVPAGTAAKYDGFFRKQANAQTGLVTSHIGDEDPIKKFGTQAYDQFLRAIVSAGSPEAARILQTYAANKSAAPTEAAPVTMDVSYSPANGVINNVRISHLQNVSGQPKWEDSWEFRVNAGDNAWGGLAGIHNYVASKDPVFLKFARERVNFILALQDSDGGVRFGPKGQWRDNGDKSFFWNIKSTENAESSLYLLDNFFQLTGEKKVAQSGDQLYDWLMTEMYDYQENVFRRGAGFRNNKWVRDPLGNFATDTTAWAPVERMLLDSRLGADRQERLAKLDVMVRKTELLTGVYDGEILKGFSFSPEARSRGIISPEWSSQMAVLYKRMSEEHTGSMKADYLKRYESLKKEVAAHYTQKDGGLVAPYAVFKDGRVAANQPTEHDWNTPNAYASVASIYYAFAEAGSNPLVAVPLKFSDSAKARTQARPAQASRSLPATIEEFMNDYYLVRWKSQKPNSSYTTESGKDLFSEFADMNTLNANRDLLLRDAVEILKFDEKGELAGRVVKLWGVPYSQNSVIPIQEIDKFLAEHYIAVLKDGRGAQFITLADLQNQEIHEEVRRASSELFIQDRNGKVSARIYLAKDIDGSKVEIIGENNTSAIYALLGFGIASPVKMESTVSSRSITPENGYVHYQADTTSEWLHVTKTAEQSVNASTVTEDVYEIIKSSGLDGEVVETLVKRYSKRFKQGEVVYFDRNGIREHYTVRDQNLSLQDTPGSVRLDTDILRPLIIDGRKVEDVTAFFWFDDSNGNGYYVDMRSIEDKDWFASVLRTRFDDGLITTDESGFVKLNSGIERDEDIVAALQSDDRLSMSFRDIHLYSSMRPGKHVGRAVFIYSGGSSVVDGQVDLEFRDMPEELIAEIARQRESGWDFVWKIDGGGAAALRDTEHFKDSSFLDNPEIREALARFGITKDTVLNESFVTTHDFVTTRDYRLPFEYQERKFLTVREESGHVIEKLIPFEFDSRTGMVIKSFKLTPGNQIRATVETTQSRIKAGEILNEEFEKTFSDFVARRLPGTSTDMWEHLARLGITRGTVLTENVETPRLVGKDGRYTRESDLAIKRYLIPHDSRGRDIVSVYPDGKMVLNLWFLEGAQNLVVNFNGGHDPQTVSLRGGILPGIVLTDRKSGKLEEVALYSPRTNGDFVPYSLDLVRIPFDENKGNIPLAAMSLGDKVATVTERIGYNPMTVVFDSVDGQTGPTTYRGYDYIVMDSKLKRKAVYTPGGQLLAERFARVNVSIAKGMLGSILNNTDIVVYDLNSEYRRPIQAYNVMDDGSVVITKSYDAPHFNIVHRQNGDATSRMAQKVSLDAYESEGLDNTKVFLQRSEYVDGDLVDRFRPNIWRNWLHDKDIWYGFFFGTLGFLLMLMAPSKWNAWRAQKRRAKESAAQQSTTSQGAGTGPKTVSQDERDQKRVKHEQLKREIRDVESRVNALAGAANTAFGFQQGIVVSVKKKVIAQVQNKLASGKTMEEIAGEWFRPYKTVWFKPVWGRVMASMGQEQKFEQELSAIDQFGLDEIFLMELVQMASSRFYTVTMAPKAYWFYKANQEFKKLKGQPATEISASSLGATITAEMDMWDKLLARHFQKGVSKIDYLHVDDVEYLFRHVNWLEWYHTQDGQKTIAEDTGTEVNKNIHKAFYDIDTKPLGAAGWFRQIVNFKYIVGVLLGTSLVASAGVILAGISVPLWGWVAGVAGAMAVLWSLLKGAEWFDDKIPERSFLRKAPDFLLAAGGVAALAVGGASFLGIALPVVLTWAGWLGGLAAVLRGTYWLIERKDKEWRKSKDGKTYNVSDEVKDGKSWADGLVRPEVGALDQPDAKWMEITKQRQNRATLMTAWLLAVKFVSNVAIFKWIIPALAHIWGGSFVAPAWLGLGLTALSPVAWAVIAALPIVFILLLDIFAYFYATEIFLGYWEAKKSAVNRIKSWGGHSLAQGEETTHKLFDWGRVFVRNQRPHLLVTGVLLAGSLFGMIPWLYFGILAGGGWGLLLLRGIANAGLDRLNRATGWGLEKIGGDTVVEKFGVSMKNGVVVIDPLGAVRQFMDKMVPATINTAEGKVPITEEQKLLVFARAWNHIINQFYQDDLVSEQERTAYRFAIEQENDEDFFVGQVTKVPDLSKPPKVDQVASRIEFTLSTYFMDMDKTPTWENLPLFSGFTPVGGETWIYPFSTKEFPGGHDGLNQKYLTGSTYLTYMITRYSQEWKNFVARLDAENEANPSAPGYEDRKKDVQMMRDLIYGDILGYQPKKGQVSEQDFKFLDDTGANDKKINIFSRLKDTGYIDENGRVLPKFDNMWDVFDIGSDLKAAKDAVWTILQDAVEYHLHDANLEMQVRLWASYRYQAFSRTARGMMNYRTMYLWLAKTNYPTIEAIRENDLFYDEERDKDKTYEQLIEDIVSRKWEYVAASAPYGSFVADEEGKKLAIAPADKKMQFDAMNYLIRNSPGMKIVYSLKDITSEYGAVVEYRSQDAPINEAEGEVLFKQFYRLENGQQVPDGKVVRSAIIRVPGIMFVGQGKPMAQNNISRFVRGEIMQLMDMNQDMYLEETFKAPNLMQEFKNPRVAIVGFPEDINTKDSTPAGAVHAFGDHTFVTIVQRVLDFFGIRYHYGHPDFTRNHSFVHFGLFSAPWVNEDIFGAYKGTLYGELVINREIMQASKGREGVFAGLMGISDKFGAGAGEQAVSDTLYRHNTSPIVGFSRSFLHAVASIGYFLRKPIIVLSLLSYLSVVGLFGISLFVTFPGELLFGLLGLLLSQVIALTGWAQLVHEKGLIRGTTEFLFLFPRLALNYMALILNAFSVGDKKAMVNNGDYIATGRRLGAEHYKPFSHFAIPGDVMKGDLYQFINVSGFTWVVPIAIITGMAIFIWQSAGIVWSFFPILLALSAVVAPFLMNAGSTPITAGTTNWWRQYKEDLKDTAGKIGGAGEGKDSNGFPVVNTAKGIRSWLIGSGSVIGAIAAMIFIGQGIVAFNAIMIFLTAYLVVSMFDLKAQVPAFIQIWQKALLKSGVAALAVSALALFAGVPFIAASIAALISFGIFMGTTYLLHGGWTLEKRFFSDEGLDADTIWHALVTNGYIEEVPIQSKFRGIRKDSDADALILPKFREIKKAADMVLPESFSEKLQSKDLNILRQKIFNILRKPYGYRVKVQDAYTRFNLQFAATFVMGTLGVIGALSSFFVALPYEFGLRIRALFNTDFQGADFVWLAGMALGIKGLLVVTGALTGAWAFLAFVAGASAIGSFLMGLLKASKEDADLALRVRSTEITPSLKNTAAQKNAPSAPVSAPAAVSAAQAPVEVVTDAAQIKAQADYDAAARLQEQTDQIEQGLMLQAYARGRALEQYQRYLENKLNSLPDAAAVAQEVEQQGLVQQDPDQLGGISFNENSLVINLKVDGEGMPLPADMQSPEVVSIAGLTPVIRDISPVTSRNVPVLMELMRGAAL